MLVKNQPWILLTHMHSLVALPSALLYKYLLKPTMFKTTYRHLLRYKCFKVLRIVNYYIATISRMPHKFSAKMSCSLFFICINLISLTSLRKVFKHLNVTYGKICVFASIMVFNMVGCYTVVILPLYVISNQPFYINSTNA